MFGKYLVNILSVYGDGGVGASGRVAPAREPGCPKYEYICMANIWQIYGRYMEYMGMEVGVAGLHRPGSQGVQSLNMFGKYVANIWQIYFKYMGMVGRLVASGRVAPAREPGCPKYATLAASPHHLCQLLSVTHSLPHQPTSSR